jgi:YfiH family protein
MTKSLRIVPAVFAPHGNVGAAFSMKGEGTDTKGLGCNLSFKVGDDPARVESARREFFASVRLTPEAVAVPDQIHATVVQYVTKGGSVAQCDALVTSTPGIGLVVTVADCVPILLYDQRRHAIGAVHAGWRGTAGQIVVRAIETMQEQFGTRSQDIVAWIGPAAGSCCYKVGDEVASQFPDELKRQKEGSWVVDLKNSNRAQLIHSGVNADSIECSPLCTICSPFLHSFRRDGERSGRMMAIIVMNQ